MPAITRMKDIAKQLGVSPATVSLVLSNKPGVSDATRARILETLKKTGYDVAGGRPMLHGGIMNLQLIVYKKQGLVVSDTPFFSELIEGIQREAHRHGLDLTVTYVSDSETDRLNAKLLGGSAADGIILLATEMQPPDLRPFQKGKFRLVVLDAHFMDEPVEMVMIDNTQGAYAAVDYLIQSGHRRIGYLGGSLRIRNFEEREHGYRMALRHAGIPVDESLLLSVEPTLEGAYRDCAALFAGGMRLPTAFFADNDIIAVGAIKALREKGVRIPQEVSLVGFDDMPVCTVVEPALTTMRVCKRKMGRIAVRRLLESARDDDGVFCSTAIHTDLVIRDSVAVCHEAG